MNYSIGEFSKLINISIYTLIYYEKNNLISPKRDERNGRRIYNEKDISWINFIKRLKDTKMSIKDIQRYSYLRNIGQSTLNQRLELLENHKENLEMEIKSLNDNLEKLKHKIQYYKNELNKFEQGNR